MSRTKKHIILATVVLALLIAAVSFGVASFASETPTVSIAYHNLSYKSNVSIVYAVRTTNLPEGAEVGVAVRKGNPNSATVYEAECKGDTTIDGESYLTFEFLSLEATEMAVDVYATPYIKISDTETVTGKTMKNSVLDYSYKILGKIEGGKELPEAVNNLISRMLTYGAAVQTYSGYNTDRLANADYYQISVANGTLPDGFSKGLYQEGDTVTLVASSKEGYTCTDWKNSAGVSVGSGSELSVTVGAANETYTAVYEVDTSIEYVLDGGVLPSGDWSNYAQGSIFTLPVPTRDRYSFIGWYTSPGFEESTKISAIPADAIGGYTLYAKWEIKEYGIIYVLNGGALPSGSPDKYAEGSTLTLPVPTKSGYIFLGWFTTSDFNENTRIAEIPVGATGDFTLYAKWKVDRSDEAEQYKALVEAQRENLATLTGYWNKEMTTGTTKNPLVNLFSDYTTDMVALANQMKSESLWHKNEMPSIYDYSENTISAPAIKDEHPRLLLTEDNLPLIRQMLEEDDITNTNFKHYIDSTYITNDCILQERVDGNYRNESWLSIIQAKALGYLLYDEEVYGYQAILYIKNYISTVYFKRIPDEESGGDAGVTKGVLGYGDMCRNYGYAMFTAALVYDWCYDLLTETDKTQIIAGVENCLCRDPYGVKAKYSKMEIGFPPARQSSVAGHGNEYQIFRDYLAFSIAIYGDDVNGDGVYGDVNSWYEYIGGRVYNDFIPMREYYFQTGVVWQGTGYALTRNVPAIYSAWLLKVATGENPYGEGLQNAIWGLFNYEVAPGYTFTDGDGYNKNHTEDRSQLDVLSEYEDLRHHAYMIAYLYGDSDMLAMAEYLIDEYYIHSNKDDDGPFSNGGYGGLSYVGYVVLRGLGELEPSDNRYEKMELIKYNGSPLGQYTIRNVWDSESAAAAFMKIKERSTAGHEHMDSGTFEIYYKDMLTSDGGCYNDDGHDHTLYYHDATISHNGLIIYNPSLSSSEKGYYSGGQERPSESNNLAAWLANTSTETGEVTGRQHGYSADGSPLYAYIAGDITDAYASSTVDYVGRRMLTVYTGNADFPMAFFVYDDVESDVASYEKRFLLQITSENAPTIDADKKTVTTENGEGRLVLTCLSDNVEFNSYGGRVYTVNTKGETVFDAHNSFNYQINGEQVKTKTATADDGHWGRVEIVSTAGTEQAKFMNVLYVTDAGQTKAAPSVTKISGNGVTGGIFGDVAAIFATSRSRATGSLSATVSGSGNVNYYVSGVAAGTWNITVGGVSYGTATATAEGGLLTFTAPAGNLVITPAN